ncbi:hypothetical protein HFO05_12260 [Rhizobium laguerreae]|uniref:hypothetical protein n=1 Tax=Rhizobium laguerreae TaxID=1076926 RepID=UPI001C90AFFE|nr:hypothetical protein [Rhizobium laguerreae]MBY3269379.1 hypothetical protein [Rhizobium laguerreae]
MTPIFLLPTIHVSRAWLDREALRIAAGVHGASRNNVADQIYRGHLRKGIPDEQASADALLAVAWIDARLDQIEALRATPAPLPEGARWKA